MANYLLFDFDGTIANTKAGITTSVQYALSHFGIQEDDLECLTRFIGPPLEASFMKYYGLDREKARAAISKYREYYSETGIFQNSLYDGIEELLISLKKNGKTLIVATSKPTVFAKKILGSFNLLGYFADVCGSELDNTRTRKEEVIAYALSRNNIKNVEEAVMIGDREHDIIGAKECKIRSVGVLYGFGSYDELIESGADYIVKDVPSLFPLLMEI